MCFFTKARVVALINASFKKVLKRTVDENHSRKNGIENMINNVTENQTCTLINAVSSAKIGTLQIHIIHLIMRNYNG